METPCRGSKTQKPRQSESHSPPANDQASPSNAVWVKGPEFRSCRIQPFQGSSVRISCSRGKKLHEKIMNAKRYVGKECGIRLRPPAVLYLYEDLVDGKVRKRVMPVSEELLEAEPEEASRRLRLRHGRERLAPIPHKTLNKMFYILSGHHRGESLQRMIERCDEQKETGDKSDEGKDTKKNKEENSGEETGEDTDLDDIDIPLDKIDSGDDSFW